MTRIGICRALLACLTVVAAGCGDAVETTDAGPSTDIHDATGDVTVREPTVVDEDFRIIYGYYNPGGDKPGELLVGDPRMTGSEGSPAWDSDCRLVERQLAGLDLDCTLGCLTTRDLKHIVVTTGTDAVTMGYDMQVVGLDDDLNATLLSFGPITAVRQARIAGNTLFVSRFKADCEALTGNPKTCFTFESLDLSTADTTTETKMLFTFPPSDILADSTFSGRFRVGADGSTVIIQNPEKESVTFWLYDTTKGLRQVAGPICQTTDINDACAYSGSAADLTDDAPVALTTDQKSLLLVYIENNRELRLARIDATKGAAWTSGDMASTTLLSTPGNYGTNACYNLSESWKYTRIQQPILITSDGNEVLFVAASDCSNTIGKSWTNIVAVPIDSIGKADKVRQGFYRKVTDFPQDSIPECVSILPDCLDLSPLGGFLAFAGTPLLQSDGRTIGDESPQHLTDREVMVIDVDGMHAPVQVSGDAGYRASSVLCSVDDPRFADALLPESADE